MLVLDSVYTKETGQGAEYYKPDSSLRFFQLQVGFVDDNPILIKLENLGFSDTSGTMLEVVKRCIEVWQRLVHATGGWARIIIKLLRYDDMATTSWKREDV